MAPYPARGDVADSVDLMSGYGLLPDNVGMAAQLSENTFFTDLGFSSYNGMLATLHKNTSYGLQFDLNYTWSHSIDNTSLVANSYAYDGYGFICDVLRPRLCRGNSDFDVTQYLNGNVLYTLPFGRGKEFAANIPLWADEAIGGWELSGLPIYHTGQPYMANSIAFLMSYSNEDPAILTGSLSGLTRAHVTVGSDGVVSTFKNPVTAFNQWTRSCGLSDGFAQQPARSRLLRHGSRAGQNPLPDLPRGSHPQVPLRCLQRLQPSELSAPEFPEQYGPDQPAQRVWHHSGHRNPHRQRSLCPRIAGLAAAGVLK